MKKIIFIFVFSFITSFLIAGPNLDRIIGDVISGNSLEAQQKIQSLLDDYPNNGDVLYLQALLISDGNDAIEIYKKIYKMHKNNKYADDAVMKIGEYYYVSGLYIQARNIIIFAYLHDSIISIFIIFMSFIYFFIYF